MPWGAGGRFVCEVWLAPVESVDLGSKYMLGGRTRELGVEQIVMYGFETLVVAP